MGSCFTIGTAFSATPRAGCSEGPRATSGMEAGSRERPINRIAAAAAKPIAATASQGPREARGRDEGGVEGKSDARALGALAPRELALGGAERGALAPGALGRCAELAEATSERELRTRSTILSVCARAAAATERLSFAISLG
jgi:hypothetical protein